MVCARYSDALNEVAAGGPATAGLDAHLAGCAQCTKKLAALRQLLTIADDELGQSLAVQPSAGFVPRIRVAVNFNAAQGRRRLWLWPSLATAAALIMTFILFVTVRPQHDPGVAVEKLRSQPVATRATEPMREAANEPMVPNGKPTPVIVSPRHTIRSDLPEPEVLVQPGQLQALADLVRIMNSQKVVPELLRASGEPTADLAVLTPITLKPIEIVPLDSAMNVGT